MGHLSQLLFAFCECKVTTFFLIHQIFSLFWIIFFYLFFCVLHITNDKILITNILPIFKFIKKLLQSRLFIILIKKRTLFGFSPTPEMSVSNICHFSTSWSALYKPFFYEEWFIDFFKCSCILSQSSGYCG